MAKRTGCGIEKPADLNGRRVGLDTLQNSAGLWMRGILQDHYGVDLGGIEWWPEEEDVALSRPRDEGQARGQGRSIDQMLLDGELEAALYPEVLPSIRSGSPKVGLLFPDPRRPRSIHFKRSGIFPTCTRSSSDSILENTHGSP